MYRLNKGTSVAKCDGNVAVFAVGEDGILTFQETYSTAGCSPVWASSDGTPSALNTCMLPCRVSPRREVRLSSQPPSAKASCTRGVPAATSARAAGVGVGGTGRAMAFS